jgi:hypothetical protein
MKKTMIPANQTMKREKRSRKKGSKRSLKAKRGSLRRNNSSTLSRRTTKSVEK